MFSPSLSGALLGTRWGNARASLITRAFQALQRLRLFLQMFSHSKRGVASIHLFFFPPGRSKRAWCCQARRDHHQFSVVALLAATLAGPGGVGVLQIQKHCGVYRMLLILHVLPALTTPGGNLRRACSAAVDTLASRLFLWALGGVVSHRLGSAASSVCIVEQRGRHSLA